MADQQQQPLKAPFPPPPRFYKSFTAENLAQLRRVRKESEPDAELNILALPPELRYLIPPQPPSENWNSYGDALTQHTQPTTLTEQGIEQLYPTTASASANPQPHLLALARSLLTTFLSLVGILSQNPTLYEGRVEDLQVLCYNMHDLINQYRPHQARESLILMMEERVRRLKDETHRIRDGKERVAKLMQGLAEGGDRTKEKTDISEGGEVKCVENESERNVKQRGAWAAIEQEAGENEDE